MRASIAITFCLALAVMTPILANAAEEPAYWQYVEQECQPYRQALLEVDALLDDIKRIYADEPETVERILTAQQAWQSYLDARIDAMYHGGTPVVGSVHKLCICHLMLPMVEMRLQQLRYWRDGTFEGDACCGHVRWADEKAAP